MIIPTGYRILVKPDPIEEVTKSGIVLVTDEKLERAAQHIGTLIAIGEQAWKAFSKNYKGDPWAEVGDKIIYSKYAGKFVKDPVTGEEFVLLNDEDVAAIIVEESNYE
jgi:co-chaperonin GroES (HSP10)